MLTNLNNLHRPCWPRNRVCLCQAVSIPHMGREPFSNHFHNVSSPADLSDFLRFRPVILCIIIVAQSVPCSDFLCRGPDHVHCAGAWIHRELYWKSKVQVARSRVVKQFVEKTPLRVRAGVRQNLTPSLTALSTFPYRHHWHDTSPIRRHHNQHDVWS